MSLVPFQQARSMAVAVLCQANAPPAHAEIQADLLLEAELRGRASHGLLRLPRIVERIVNGVADPAATGLHRWRGACLEVDGQMGLGPVISAAALKALAERVETAGLALAAIRNNNHIGMLSWYVEGAARQGFILIATSTSEALVHPWGGRHAMLGTNPIAIGVPTADAPFVMDMATSLVSMGQIHDYAGRGVPLPEGWALDASGEPTTDASAAMAGAIAPFGGPKGYALGLALEMLVVGLTGSGIGNEVKGTLDSDQPANKGDVFIMVKPDASTALPGRLHAYLDAIRTSGDDKPVSVPNDRALALRAKRIEEGIPVPPDLWGRLLTLANMEI